LSGSFIHELLASFPRIPLWPPFVNCNVEIIALQLLQPVIGYAVAFLASDKAANILGTTLDVTGGMLV
jgi:NAD(P)-dependent dehydrogenase (short-subunit alcohol dehydrogenase family)